jgi:enamine deaminase RidA (YjgF/YER057c/UK114 family)
MSHSEPDPPSLHSPVGIHHSQVADLTSKGLVLIAGQYGTGPDGAVVSQNFGEQVERAFVNLGTALAAVGLDYSNVARLGTYLVGHDADDLAVLGGVITRIWGDKLPVQTLLGVASLASPEMRFEVDALAVRS